MKTMKKALALMLVMMLVLPSIVVADVPNDIDDDAIMLDGGELDIAMDDDDFTAGDMDDLLLDEPGDIILDGVDLEPASNAANSAPIPFEQNVIINDVTITVTAGAGAFPEGAALRVSDVIEDSIAQAAREATEAALPGMAVKHHLYSIEVVDRDENLCSPNSELELPLVKVEGLVLDGAAHVVMYDQKEKQGREIEIERALEFRFVDSAVYDVVEEGKDEGTGEEDEGTGNREQE